MKITNKHDMLDAMNDINEDYLRKADKILLRHLNGEEAVKMEIAPVKFSWKSAAAAAACLAVIAAGAVGVRYLINNRPAVVNPNESGNAVNNSDSSNIDDSKSDLDKLKELFGAQNAVDYAENRLKLSEYDLSGIESVPGLFGNRPIVIDNNRVLYVTTGDFDCPVIEMRYLDSNVTSSVYGSMRNGWINKDTEIDLLYADKNYAVFTETFNEDGAPTKQELCIIEYATYDWYVIGNLGTWPSSQMVIDGNVLYFMTSSDIGNVDNRIYRYEIGSNKTAEYVDHASQMALRNGKLYYLRKDYEKNTTSLCCYGSDTAVEYNCDPVLGKYGVFGSETGGKLTEFIGGNDILTDGKTGDVKLELYDSMLLVSGGGSKAVYEIKNGELLMLGDDIDNVFTMNTADSFDGGMYAYERSEDGSFGKLYVVTVKETPEQTADRKQEYLDNFRKKYNISEKVGIAYARDRLNVTEFSLTGSDWYGVISGINNGRFFIDENRVLVDPEHWNDSIRMYLLDKGEFVTLLDRGTDPLADSETLYNIRHVGKDRIIFSRINADHKSFDLSCIDLTEEGYPVKMIGENNYIFNKNMIIDGDTMYYTSPKNTIYKYEFGKDEKPVDLGVEGYPICVYNGDLLYYSVLGSVVDPNNPLEQPLDLNDRRVIHSLSGTLPIEGQVYSSNMHATKYGVFKIYDNRLINCFTNEVIVAPAHEIKMRQEEQFNFGIMVENGFRMDFLYDAETNEILVFEEDDKVFDYGGWASTYWGVATEANIGFLFSQK